MKTIFFMLLVLGASVSNAEAIECKLTKSNQSTNEVQRFTLQKDNFPVQDQKIRLAYRDHELNLHASAEEAGPESMLLDIMVGEIQTFTIVKFKTDSVLKFTENLVLVDRANGYFYSINCRKF